MSMGELGGKTRGDERTVVAHFGHKVLDIWSRETTKCVKT